MKLIDLKTINLIESKLTDEQIRAWIDDHVTVSPSADIEISGGIVKIGRGIEINDPIDEIPFQFDTVPYYDFTGIGLKTLKGVPRECLMSNMGFSSVNENHDLKSLDGITEISNEISFGNCTGITSLAGIDKQIKSCNKIFISHTVKSHILGLLKIKNLKEVRIGLVGGKSHDWPDDLVKAVTIINTHLNNGSVTSVVKAQRELIENDLDDYAEL